MHTYVKTLMKTMYHNVDFIVKDLGGGFYGKVFLAESDTAQIVVKFFLKEGLCVQEQQQLDELRKHAILKVPVVYDIHRSNDQVPYDALLMEYIRGENAGTVDLTKGKKEKIANEIVDNLIALHNTINKEGFGEIGSAHYTNDWRTFYKPIAQSILTKSETLYNKDLIDQECIQTVRDAYQNFETIFSEPITKASLIHGDYNTYNLMLNSDCTSAIAMIDPYNCCYGDSEYDLYQLNNVNGKEYGLLDLYQSKYAMSRIWKEKMAFYELFTELMHYSDSGVEPDMKYLKPKVDQLKAVLYSRVSA